MERFGRSRFAVPIAVAGVFWIAGAGMSLAQSSAELRPSPPAFVPPLLERQQVDHAVAELDALIATAMEKTGIPGIAVGVVYRDAVIYLKGFGVREVGQPAQIDTDTVFKLASVSKPIASTIVAGVVGKGLIGWNDPVSTYNPAFRLSDPYVTANASVTDLLSHRSGLYTAAGDLLEDLGYDRAYILAHLDQQPLDAFRATYHYSNFGYTSGGEAAAVAAGQSWEDLADATLFGPMGMTRSSYRHADYLAHENRARLHVRVGDAAEAEWLAKFDRQPDAEAPAGGASASIDDMARFLRLQLGGGAFKGQQIIDADALAVTHAPHQISGAPRTPLSHDSFYGLGWNVSYDTHGRVRLGHSGAFNLGTSTNVTLIPGEDLGIVILTNGEPIGVPEAIANSFLDIVQDGGQTVDWPGLFGRIFQSIRDAEAADFAYTIPAADARPPRALAGYTGTFENDYYGPVTVTEGSGGLSLAIGPQAAPTVYALTPYDADTFTFVPVGENAVPIAGAAFRRDPGGAVSGVVLDYYDQRGLGAFHRADDR